MKKYLVLYRSDAAMSGMSASEMFANTPPEQLEAGMAMWAAWTEKCGSAIIDLGAPLDNSTVVTATEASPNKSSVSGYTILEAESIEAATALMKDHPHFFAPGATIEILESVAIPGM